MKNNSPALIIFFNLDSPSHFFTTLVMVVSTHCKTWRWIAGQEKENNNNNNPPKNERSEKSSSPQSLGDVSHKLIVINSNTLNKIFCVCCPHRVATTFLSYKYVLYHNVKIPMNHTENLSI